MLGLGPLFLFRRRLVHVRNAKKPKERKNRGRHFAFEFYPSNEVLFMQILGELAARFHRRVGALQFNLAAMG